MQKTATSRLTLHHCIKAFSTQETCVSASQPLQCVPLQRLISTSASSWDPSKPAAVSNSTANTQQAAPQGKDIAKVAHANKLRQLRKKWQTQHAEKLASKAEADAKKAANIAVTTEGRRRNMAAVKELRGKIHQEKLRLQSAELVSSSFCVCLLLDCQASKEPTHVSVNTDMTLTSCVFCAKLAFAANLHNGMQAQRQALASTFRAATQDIYAMLKDKRYDLQSVYKTVQHARQICCPHQSVLFSVVPLAAYDIFFPDIGFACAQGHNGTQWK